MASPARVLARVLTMAAWLTASIHTGSSHSGWWGTQEALALRRAAKISIGQGNFEEAERVFRHGEQVASRHHDLVAQAWFLDGVGSASLAGFRYRGALDAYLQAKALAQKARDRAALGAIDADLASVYQQVWDFDSALRSAEEAEAITRGLQDVHYRAHLLLLVGQLRSDASSISLFREGIEAAHEGSLKEPSLAVVEANGWDFLCEALLKRGDTGGADAAELRAMALRQQRARRDLGFSEWLLGAVRMKQAEQALDGLRGELLAEAERFTQQAALERIGPPAYRLAFQSGEILLAQQRVPEALAALEQAINQAQRWRLGIAPALTSLDGAATQLQSNIFDQFVDAAAGYGMRNHDPRWVEESFEANELNRAANLRDSAHSAWRRTLPLEYWEDLGRLQVEEAGLSRPDHGLSSLSAHLRLRLTELEAKAGLGDSPTIAENFPSHASLIHFQQSLKQSGVLLSFALGERESWLWAVTRNTLHVYPLPPREEIVSTVRAFRQAVERGAGFVDPGERLYNMLFGQLPLQEASQLDWQVSAEDALLELPFAGLVLEHERRSGRIVFLAERHSLQVEAGALLPGKPYRLRSGSFVSVGDPIYNVADSRWHQGMGWSSAKAWNSAKSWFSIALGSQPTGQLNRLPGTRREVEASAAAWAAAGSTTVLEGAAASRASFLQAISPAPQIIHLATHALTAPSGDQAYLAFGLGREGRPEMLSTAEIQMLEVPGSIVVMTGCATGPSGVRPGIGMAGLVRAWTVAGASAVVATEWPVQDSAASSLLPSFYRHLKDARDGTVAEALRLAQIEMIHSGTDQSAPAAWAAYQVFAGHIGSGSEAQ
jgi:CHAT domain-containing protein